MAKQSTHDTTLVLHENRVPGRAPDKHDNVGGELGDPTPMEPPLGYKRSLSLTEQIAQQVRIAHLRILEDSAIHETDDEADDFDIGEDYEPLSAHENDHMPTLANLKKRAKEIQDQIKARNLKKTIEDHKNRIAEIDKKNNKVKEGAEAPPNSPEEQNLD